MMSYKNFDESHVIQKNLSIKKARKFTTLMLFPVGVSDPFKVSQDHFESGN